METPQLGSKAGCASLISGRPGLIGREIQERVGHPLQASKSQVDLEIGVGVSWPWTRAAKRNE
jgi:hypothetical protein